MIFSWWVRAAPSWPKPSTPRRDSSSRVAAGRRSCSNSNSNSSNSSSRRPGAACSRIRSQRAGSRRDPGRRQQEQGHLAAALQQSRQVQRVGIHRDADEHGRRRPGRGRRRLVVVVEHAARCRAGDGRGRRGEPPPDGRGRFGQPLGGPGGNRGGFGGPGMGPRVSPAARSLLADSCTRRAGYAPRCSQFTHHRVVHGWPHARDRLVVRARVDAIRQQRRRTRTDRDQSTATSP